MSVRIIEVFVKMREMLLTHKDLLLEMKEIRRTVSDHGDQISLIFEYIKQLEQAKQQELEYKNRTKIGYVEKREMDTNPNYSQCITSDHGGTIVDSKLSWRRVIIGDFEIVYNMIPESMLVAMNNIFTSIKLELSETCPR